MSFIQIRDISKRTCHINVAQITYIASYEDHAVISFSGGESQDIKVDPAIAKLVISEIERRPG